MTSIDPTPAAPSTRLGAVSLIIGCAAVAVVLGAVGFIRIASEQQGVGMTILLWAAIAAVISGAALLVGGTLALVLGVRAARRNLGRRLGIVGAAIGALSLALLLYYLLRIAGAGLGLWTV